MNFEGQRKTVFILNKTDLLKECQGCGWGPLTNTPHPHTFFPPGPPAQVAWRQRTERCTPKGSTQCAIIASTYSGPCIHHPHQDAWPLTHSKLRGEYLHKGSTPWGEYLHKDQHGCHLSRGWRQPSETAERTRLRKCPKSIQGALSGASLTLGLQDPKKPPPGDPTNVPVPTAVLPI